MKFDWIAVIFVAWLPFSQGEGFLSKLINRGKDLNDEVNACETVKVLPRIAMAVVGGSTLKFDVSAPYVVAIGEKLSNGSVSWFCGGSLLSSRDILTAAHCLVSRNASLARIGSFWAKQKQIENDNEILKIQLHPEYKITESYNDIAIVKLKEKVKFTKVIKPVCLPQGDQNRYDGERARVVGWGAEEFGGVGTQKLKQVEVEVYTNSNCEKAYRNSSIASKTFPKGIINRQLCAGSSTGGKDACQGDSGGPLVLVDENGTVRQIGIVSTGAGCGFKMYPGVYTRVSSYTHWIEEVIKNENSKSGKDSSTKRISSQKRSNKNQVSTYKEDINLGPSQNQQSLKKWLKNT